MELQHVGVTTMTAGEFEKDFFDCYARTLPYLIEKTSVFIRLKGALKLSELGADITLEQFITLDAISACPDVSQRDLAKILLKDRSNVTRILNILEKKELIHRETSNKGKRPVKRTRLSQKGRELMNRYADKMKNDLNDFLAQFNQENLLITKKMLEEISSKISENANIQI
ncbi:MAG: MarR family transcriptional regulator [Clostridium sp.]|nr:MarR family transcriptional regulator [Clostridium sp.]